jgi:hypothetical protein
MHDSPNRILTQAGKTIGREYQAFLAAHSNLRSTQFEGLWMSPPGAGCATLISAGPFAETRAPAGGDWSITVPAGHWIAGTGVILMARIPA